MKATIITLCIVSTLSGIAAMLWYGFHDKPP